MLLGKNPTDSAYYAPFGFMTKYEKPTKPYIVKRVWVLAYGMISETSKFGLRSTAVRLTICRMLALLELNVRMPTL